MGEIVAPLLPASLLRQWFELEPLDFTALCAHWPAALLAPDDAGCERLFERCIAEQRYDEAAAACIAALQARWESGRDAHLASPWIARAGQLEHAPACRPMARAALAVQRRIAELFWRADLAELREQLPEAWVLVEASDSNALRILLAACEGYARIMAGELHAAQEGLDDAAHFSPAPSEARIPKMHLAACTGLLDAVLGRAGAGQRALSALIEASTRAPWPATLVILLRAHHLLSLAHTGSAQEVDDAATALRAIALPDNKAAHRGYLHFALGVAHLLHGQAAQARTHAEMASEQGQRSGCASAQHMPPLLLVQALNDLNELERARTVLDAWLPRWQSGGFALVRCAALLELAQIELKDGKVMPARQALTEAIAAVPSGEHLPDYHRRAGFAQALCRRLGVDEPGAPDTLTDAHYVRVQMLGELRIRCGDRELFDRDWRGARSKSLLKALVVAGGSKVALDRLADRLWPDSDGAQARQNLKVALSRLRHLVQTPQGSVPPWVATQHGQVSLVATWCWVDALEFERQCNQLEGMSPAAIADLLALYRGDFLANDDSEPWISAHRDKLQRLYIATCHTLAKTCLSEQLFGLAEPHLQRALDMAPQDERSRDFLMRLHLAAGHAGQPLASQPRSPNAHPPHEHAGPQRQPVSPPTHEDDISDDCTSEVTEATEASEPAPEAHHSH